MAARRRLTKHQRQFIMQPLVISAFGRTVERQYAFNIFPDQDTYAKRNYSN
jgi:hypothetical protein